MYLTRTFPDPHIFSNYIFSYGLLANVQLLNRDLASVYTV